MTAKTIRVRVAVAVWPDGHWATVEGSRYLKDRDWLACIAEMCEGGEPPSISHFIEADVPVPTPQEIEGEVVE